MNRKPHHRSVPFAGPKALAVLSCALALLTAQPWTASASPATQTAAVRSIGASAKIQGDSPAPDAGAPSKPAPAAIDNRQLSSVPESDRLRATWAAIHHWIVASLMTSHTSDAGVMHLDISIPAQIKFEWQPDIDVEGMAVEPPQLPELQWAIERLLLAPPIC